MVQYKVECLQQITQTSSLMASTISDTNSALSNLNSLKLWFQLLCA